MEQPNPHLPGFLNNIQNPYLIPKFREPNTPFSALQNLATAGKRLIGKLTSQSLVELILHLQNYNAKAQPIKATSYQATTITTLNTSIKRSDTETWFQYISIVITQAA